jgi:predicted MFS family arabinose efflux permease
VPASFCNHEVSDARPQQRPQNSIRGAGHELLAKPGVAGILVEPCVPGRSRLNGLYMTMFFLAGAAGSAVGGWAYATGGWALASSIGAALPIASLIYLATESD